MRRVRPLRQRATFAVAALPVTMGSLLMATTPAEGQTRSPRPPSITVTPDIAAYTEGQRPFGVTGENFDVGEVVLRVDRQEVGRADVGKDRSFRTSFAAAGLACGEHTVSAVHPRARQFATARLVVTCPALKVEPAVIDGANRPPTLKVTGTGFDPRTEVGLSTSGTADGFAWTDGGGSFQASVPADDLPCGRSPVVAVERVRLPVPPRAEGPVTVRCARVTAGPATPDPAPETVPARGPVLVVRPGVAATGSTVRVEGRGFTPNGTVRLTWQLETLRPGLGTAQATADETGSFSTTMLVFVKDQVGRRRVLAAESEPSPVTAVSETVLAVRGSIQPGRQSTADIARRTLVRRR